MSLELLEKEEQYRKLNEKLELQSKEIMKEFESVLKKQDDILHEASMKAENLSSVYKLGNTKKSFSKAEMGVEVEVDENLVPKSVDEMGVKGMSQFYKTRIKTMQNSYEKLQIEYKMKAEELRNILMENKKLTEEKEKWFNFNNSSKNQVSKLENQFSCLTSKLQAKESENISLKKEIEQLKKEARNLTHNISANDVKMNRLHEENEKMKTALQNAKKDEADLKLQHRKEIEKMAATLKMIEKQKLDVVSAFKKQMFLVDNLKKQKAILEALKVADFAENDFLKLLEWNKND